MMYSIQDATLLLRKGWFACTGINIVFAGMFLAVMYYIDSDLKLSGKTFLVLILLASLVGIVHGLYITYRARFSPSYSIVMQIYFIVLVEIIGGGSVFALMIIIIGRPDLRWIAFTINALGMALTLIISMVIAARAMGMWDQAESWRQRIDAYLDYSKRLVSPTLTSDTINYKKVKYPYLIMGGGIGTIPLLFRRYGGGEKNAIYFVTPLIALTLSYMNLKTFGPALVRLFLLRKIEKEQGFRFQNADYEKIQELRRGFFLAKWLMKDYRPPQMQADSENNGPSKRHKNKKR